MKAEVHIHGLYEGAQRFYKQLTSYIYNIKDLNSLMMNSDIYVLRFEINASEEMYRNGMVHAIIEATIAEYIKKYLIQLNISKQAEPPFTRTIRVKDILPISYEILWEER